MDQDEKRYRLRKIQEATQTILTALLKIVFVGFILYTTIKFFAK